jgi:hypothetical protein
MKTCSQCHEEKTLDQFRPGTKSAKCKSCLKVYDNAYYEKNKHKWREREKRLREEDGEAFLQKSREAQARYRANPNNTINLRYLKARYGITPDDYVAMFDAQGGCCAICGVAGGIQKGERLHVDHCHVSGKVRALLCFDCNRGLGSFKDSPEVLQKAIDYLSKYGT